VVLPKMFRRLVGFNENPNGTKSLEAFLALKQNKKDKVIDLKVFKTLTPAQRANPTLKKNHVPLIQLSTLGKNGDRLTADPEAIVFVEQGATLKNNDGKVTDWNAKGVPFKPK